ncbi:hypothetical protein Cs7R123_39250 [Catellatospora sp. TT07R-123]|uniref:hypothetical protein n=1 Tax=Catellatospora sp. TT07R-123 TaxID=2733863 RepID=UPI001B2E8AF7|nr:hypothetical protein [Catellatospora sp. TT07R-123]GHJ46583.1 hypothetical protein Cs7R123_39250 [Catellatospora sp. TT07R-123]
MSLTRLRWLYALLLLTTSAFALLSWLTGGDLLVEFATRALTLVLSLVLIGAALIRPNGRARRFAVTGTAFRTYGRSVYLTLLGVLAMQYNTAVVRVGDTSVFATTSLGVAVLVAVVLGLALWRPYRLDLGPEGIRVGGAVGHGRVIPWALLQPGLPARPGERGWTLPLAYTHPDALPPNLRRLRALPLGWAVHPHLLADAIRWYTEHPEHRAAIGTQAEHDRLVAALAARA